MEQLLWGRRDWEPAAAKCQPAAPGWRVRRAPAVFGELPLQSSPHLLSAAGRQKQEAGGGVGPGLVEIGLDKGR